MIYIARTWTIDVIQSFENDFQNNVRLNFNAVVKTLATDLSLSDIMLSDLQYFQFKPYFQFVIMKEPNHLLSAMEVKNCRYGPEIYTSKR